MTMEVSELLSCAVLGTSGLASKSSTPKRPGSLVLATVLPLEPEDSAKPVDTSSQVSTPEDVNMDDPTLEEIQASLAPWSKVLGLVGKLPLWMWPDSRRRPKRPWVTCWWPGLPLMHNRGSRSLTLGWPSIKTSQRPLKPSRKQRPSVLTPSRMWRPARQQ